MTEILPSFFIHSLLSNSTSFEFSYQYGTIFSQHKPTSFVLDTNCLEAKTMKAQKCAVKRKKEVKTLNTIIKLRGLNLFLDLQKYADGQGTSAYECVLSL